ncbi:MAG TPA: ferritin family protein [Anaerohalosphaeraceae bacterium]|nr:ferritin family protein [Anaerohalosphaeraceae bacterium]HRT49705.1 ferritin family protein [Anaerohalosphaeraceae bacterium]HRT87641.1 ferritin family protein [Anaerohalosphaeraceae bacterium]
MSIRFSADEIFEMAEEIERNGARLYRKAAEKAADKDTKEYLLSMAVMEDNHLKTFAAMRQSLSAAEKEVTTFDPNDEAALYLDAMAGSHGTEGKKSLTEELTGQESIEEVLRIAIKAEKDSVVFYTGLKSLVPEPGSRQKVEKIIAEELSHIATLSNKLKEVTSPRRGQR